MRDTQINRYAISFSLYGDAAKYSVGMVENVILARTIYPGWDVIVHIEEGHYARDRLVSEGAITVDHPKSVGHTGMRWRFETVDYVYYDRIVIRDADSRVNPREKAAVDAWIESGKSLHVMRDHKQHRRPIMGGGWGLVVGAVDMSKLMADRTWNGKYGDDEDFLANDVWPILKDDVLQHDSRNGNFPFPSHEPWEGHQSQRVEVGDEGFVDAIRAPNVRVVMLSLKKYEKRRKRFHDSLLKNGGFLNRLGIEVWWATPHQEMYAPPAFRKVRKRKHWWAATCDHLKIMEETIVSGADYLILLEDDAEFLVDFEERFWRAWCALPQGWKAMRLGWHVGHAPSEVMIPGVLDRCDPSSGLMLGVLWSKEGLRRAYDHFWHRRKLIIDMAFADLRRREPKDWYQPTTPIIVIDSKSRQQGRDS
jgi:hypothetical protein